MRKIMMIYNLKGNASNRIRFNRKLFNYKIQSHKRKYRAISKGILKKYEKPVRSVVIFEQKYLAEVRKILDEFEIDYSLYEIQKKIK